MSICLLDTSVFVEFLNVPNMNTRHAGICDELKQKSGTENSCFFPWQPSWKPAITLPRMGMERREEKLPSSLWNRCSLLWKESHLLRP